MEVSLENKHSKGRMAYLDAVKGIHPMPLYTTRSTDQIGKETLATSVSWWA